MVVVSRYLPAAEAGKTGFKVRREREPTAEGERKHLDSLRRRSLL